MVRLRHAPPTARSATAQRQVALLHEFQDILARDGMADMEEYGDMLKWALPSRDGWCRYFHAYDPSFCSFSDAFRGTVHDHGGTIRGTVLIGHIRHQTYEATPDADGDRVWAGQPVTLQRHAQDQPEGTEYELAPHVAHWPVPTTLTVTYFEEEDNGVMGELVDPIDGVHDEQPWTQETADAWSPTLRAAIEARLAALR